MSPERDISKRRYYYERQNKCKEPDLLEILFSYIGGDFVQGQPERNNARAVDRAEDQGIDTIVVPDLVEPVIYIVEHLIWSGYGH
jgi:hypothetical protein